MEARTTGTSVPRRAIATYPDYVSAQRAVDHLADNKFPVERTAIVAEGLKIVEQVQGRLNWLQAALNGGFSGLVTGGFVGLLLGIFLTVPPGGLLLALYGAFLGALAGALIGVVLYALSGGRRDFYSARSMQAERYAVMVDEEVADEALRLLGGLTAPPPGAVAG